MKSIKIDNEVYTYPQKKAIAFEEEPIDVLRLIFNLKPVNTPREGYLVGEAEK